LVESTPLVRILWQLYKSHAQHLQVNKSVVIISKLALDVWLQLLQWMF